MSDDHLLVTSKSRMIEFQAQSLRRAVITLRTIVTTKCLEAELFVITSNYHYHYQAKHHPDLDLVPSKLDHRRYLKRLKTVKEANEIWTPNFGVQSAMTKIRVIGQETGR